MKRSAHSQYSHQIDYFTKEFIKNTSYALKAWHESYLEKIARFVINNKKSGILLDIGTGEGYVAIEMARQKYSVIACDLTKQSLDNIARTKRKLGISKLRLLQCSAEALPLKDNSVDFAVANAILEHLPREREAIREWKRILKPGGRLMVTVPLKFRYIWPFFWPINYVHDQQIGHLRRYDISSLRSKFDMKVVVCLYTGHSVKVFGTLLSMILKTGRFDKILEQIDKFQQHVAYGASNIIVVFEK